MVPGVGFPFAGSRRSAYRDKPERAGFTVLSGAMLSWKASEMSGDILWMSLRSDPEVQYLKVGKVRYAAKCLASS